MTKVLDLPKARRLAAKAVEAKGADHVQNTCYYVTEQYDGYYGRSEKRWQGNLDPQPGCLVGQVLWFFDKDAIVSAASEDMINGNIIIDDSVVDTLAAKGVRITAPALAFLNHAQEGQDGRHRDHAYGFDRNLPWGEAVERASEKIKK